MKSPDEIIAFLRDTLSDRADARGVPAAAVAVLVDGEIVDHATGTLNTATGVEATTDSVFQIGSITKVWTATLVMQLVDEGLVGLDEPVRTYLPEFRLADADAADAITVRQLLSHQAGFEGDVFTDTGRGDDAVEKYVALLAASPGSTTSTPSRCCWICAICAPLGERRHPGRSHGSPRTTRRTTPRSSTRLPPGSTASEM